MSKTYFKFVLEIIRLELDLVDVLDEIMCVETERAGEEPGWGKGGSSPPTPRNSIGGKGEGGVERGKEEKEEGAPLVLELAPPLRERERESTIPYSSWQCGVVLVDTSHNPQPTK